MPDKTTVADVFASRGTREVDPADELKRAIDAAKAVRPAPARPEPRKRLPSPPARYWRRFDTAVEELQFALYEWDNANPRGRARQRAFTALRVLEKAVISITNYGRK